MKIYYGEFGHSQCAYHIEGNKVYSGEFDHSNCQYHIEY